MRATLGIIVGCVIWAGGCATTAQRVTDSFCLSPASKKRSWNPEVDSVERMREAVTWNHYVDRRCGIPGQRA
jgi:hypothetical protein